MCMRVCAIAEKPFPGHIWSNTSRFFQVFVVSMMVCVLKLFRVFGSVRTSLLHITGELAGGGSLAVAVRVSGK